MGNVFEYKSKLTVEELSYMAHSPIKVMSGFNGRVLCKEYNSKKHHETIGKRIITSIWAESYAKNDIAFGNTIHSRICVYVHGGEEFKKHMKELEAKRNAND